MSSIHVWMLLCCLGVGASITMMRVASLVRYAVMCLSVCCVATGQSWTRSQGEYTFTVTRLNKQAPMISRCTFERFFHSASVSALLFSSSLLSACAPSKMCSHSPINGHGMLDVLNIAQPSRRGIVVLIQLQYRLRACGQQRCTAGEVSRQCIESTKPGSLCRYVVCDGTDVRRKCIRCGWW